MNIVRIYLVLALCAASVSRISARDQHMICKAVEDVFAQDNNPDTPTSAVKYVQGRAGKLGPRGIKGDPGPRGEQGPPGVFRNEDVISLIDERIQSAIQKLEKRIDQRPNEPTAATKGSVTCELVSDGKCFWSTVYTARNTTYQAGVETCNTNGGHPADVIDAGEYNLLTDHLRSKMSGSMVQLWLGMSINTATKAVTLFDGSPSRYQKWYPSYPLSNKKYKKIMVQLSSTSTAGSQGMFNYAPTYDAHGVVCQN